MRKQMLHGVKQKPHHLNFCNISVLFKNFIIVYPFLTAGPYAVCGKRNVKAILQSLPYVFTEHWRSLCKTCIIFHLDVNTHSR